MLAQFPVLFRFAGPDNFCPVLVGSLGGALFGCDMDLESLADEDVPDVLDVPGNLKQFHRYSAKYLPTRSDEPRWFSQRTIL